MRMKKAFLLLFLLTGYLFQATAQDVTLVVTTTNGVEHTYQMSDESQLYFNNGESLVIEESAGTTVTFQLSEIRKIVCSEITSTDENAVSKLQVQPNPSHNSFIVRNLTETCRGRVFSLDGRLVKDFEASEGSVIDISELSEGMYLLNINGQTLKLMKL